MPLAPVRICKVTCAILAALVNAVPTALAQRAGGEAALEEIVVTARKREEALQTVPVSITAFTAEALQRSNITSLQDVAQLTPGLIFQDLNVQLSIPIIRGVAPTNTSSDNAVGMFLNGIYLSNRRALDVAMVNLERIEVIKGPQSALYGQDSFSGAINYVTRAPGERFEGSAQVSVGSDEYYDGQAWAGGPLGERVGATVAANWKRFDGTFENLADRSDNLQGYESFGVSGQIDWEVTDSFEASLFGYYTEAEAENPAQYLLPNNCGRTATGAPTAFCGVVPADLPFDITPEADGIPFGRDTQALLTSLVLRWQLNESWAISSQTGFVSSKSINLLDLDYTSAGVPFPVRNTATNATRAALLNYYVGQAGGEADDLSQELKLEFTSGEIGGFVGLYYYDSDRKAGSDAAIDTRPLAAGEIVDNVVFRRFTTNAPAAPLPSNRFENEVEMRAIFGQLEWQATDRLRATAELRYTEDTRSIDRQLNFGAPVTVNPRQEDTFSYVAPRATLDFRLTPEVMLYGSWAVGNRPGGFNQNATLVSESSFDPEKIKSYEIGLKSQWLDRRLLANVAAFYMDWSDVQVAGRSQDPANIFNITTNSGNAIVSGLELETAFRFNDVVSAGVNYAYANPRFTAGSRDLLVAGFCGVGGLLCADPGDVGGQQLGRSVKNQATAWVEFGSNLQNGWTWSLRADGAYLDKNYIDALNLTTIDSYTLVNARAAIGTERWEFALWAKNLGDEQYLTGITNQPKFHVGATVETTHGYGRQVGATAIYRF
jgi:iron complex outermembrane recepter protein